MRAGRSIELRKMEFKVAISFFLVSDLGDDLLGENRVLILDTSTRG